MKRKLACAAMLSGLLVATAGRGMATTSTTPSAGAEGSDSPQTSAQPSPTPFSGLSSEGYQQTRWGMSPDQVKKLYPAMIHKDSVWAVLGQRIADHPAAIVFFFAQNKLTVVAVAFDESYVNNNNYLRDYDEVKPLLAKKYGPAVLDREEWSQDLYKDDPSEWGMAVAAGHLRKWTNFETPKTSVQLILSGENFKISMRIRYASRELEGLNDEADEADKASGL